MTSAQESGPRVDKSLGRTLRENRIVQGLLLIAPADLYLFLLIVLPLLLVAGLSFLSRGEYGQVVFKFNPGIG